MKSKLAFAASGLLLVACVIGIVAAATRSTTHSLARDAAPTTSIAAPPDRHIGASDLAAMRTGGDQVVLMPSSGPGSVSAKVDAQTALSSVESSLGFVRTGDVASTDLATLTDTQYGPVSTSARNGTTSVTPKIVNRLVWLFVLDDFNMPIQGPELNGGSGIPEPTGNRSRMWAAVDANTGQFLIAESITPDD